MGTTFNRRSQTPFRQHLRTHGTRAEIVMWLNLKGRQLLGYKFRRQYGVRRNVVDFYCPELQLAIEVDGASHEGQESKARDRRRQVEIEHRGIRLLRLTDDEVLGNVGKAVKAIEAEVRRICDHPRPTEREGAKAVVRAGLYPLLDVRRGSRPPLGPLLDVRRAGRVHLG